MTADDRSASLTASEADAHAAGGFDEGRGGAQSLRNLWQVPAIVVSGVLIAAALYFASKRAPTNDFDGVLDQTQRLITVGELETAADIIENTLMPNLGVATPSHLGRFHALAGDWVAATQEQAGTPVDKFNERIVEEYALAEQYGAPIGVPRHQRWGNALLDLGRTAEARTQLDALDGLTGSPEHGADAQRAHNQLLRRIVESSIAKPVSESSGEAFALSRARATFEQNMQLLATYRANPRIGIADEAWAIAREAELRLVEAEFSAAINRLQIDMRRLERRLEQEGSAEFDSLHQPEPWGELYTLLGRAYLESGDPATAEHYLQVAMKRFEVDDARRRDAMLQLAYIDRARSDHEAAIERLNEVIGADVRDHTAEPWFLPALLARAELESLLGRHEDSLADFAQLVSFMARASDGTRVRRENVANVLVDRLESALMHDDLELGLRYVTLAEPLFERGNVPGKVLERIAITNRQIADNIMAQGRASLGAHADRVDLVPADLRVAANERYVQAGRYFERYARSAQAMAEEGSDEEAQALWRAGESFDLGGDLDSAIMAFRDFDGGFRPHPLWPEVAYRLGQAYRARGDVEDAATTFRNVIDEHAASTYGTRSLVPYAECLVDLGETAEAKQHLKRVVEGLAAEPDEFGDPGRVIIEPGSRDYIEAQLALGRLLHDDIGTNPDRTPEEQARIIGEAIATLDGAARSLAGDRRLEEARYRLADAHRQLADLLGLMLGPLGPKLSQTERDQTEAKRRGHLETALDGFGLVVAGYGRLEPRLLDAQQRDFERNAALYRADCAYDLGDFDRALSLYDEAARRYHDHYASMHALVQIVNGFIRKGDWSRAQIAHDKAMKRLEQLPEEVFSDPRSIMDRQAWQEWLRNMPIAVAQEGGTT